MEAIETKTFSPKELADIVGVSQSSIKRWVDDGLIDVHRTAGGHRRIPMREALHFIRSRDMRVLRPDLLGLPDLLDVPSEAREGAFTGDVLFHLLRKGEAAKVRGIIASRYLNGTPLAELFDGPMADALARLGELWKQGDEGIYAEHVATTICIEAINQIRILMPPNGPEAPVAVGGAPANDPYMLPSLMAAAVLADAGYEVTNLGPDSPHAALLHAVDLHEPDLVWLAITTPVDEAELRELVQELLLPLQQHGVDVIVGGRQAVKRHAELLPEGVHTMTSMSELAAYAKARAAA